MAKTAKTGKGATRDNRKQVILRIDPEWHRQLKAYVGGHETTLNELFISKVDAWWQERKVRKAKRKVEKAKAAALPTRLHQT